MSRAWRVIGAGVLQVVLAGSASSAAANTKVVFTIDVETNGAFRLPDQINAVCSDGSACGLMEIARLLGQRRWSGTFFLDVYEHRKWGETAMRDIAVGLQAAGQDVALHTHPQWAYDSSRWAMHQYSLDEQTAIVADGVRLLRTWTGAPVVAHRAGAYAANENTLTALERNGVLVDSSVFWQHPDSRLDGVGLPRNLPARHGRLLEIPVTAYLREARPGLFPAAFAPVTAVRKIDADWFVDEQEMKAAIDAAVAADLPVLVVFLHSFSFMTDRAGGPPVANRHSMEIFRAIMDHVARKNLAVVNMRQLAQGGLPALSSSAGDVVPRVGVSVDLPRYAWRRVQGADRVLLSTEATVAILIAAGLILARRRRSIEKSTSTAGASRARKGAPLR